MGSGADGNRSVTLACDLDRIRQEALKTLISQSRLDAEALKRHLRHCVFYKRVEVSVGPQDALQGGWGVRGGRKWMADQSSRDIRCVQAAHSEV
jgi:hypothetical protein